MPSAVIFVYDSYLFPITFPHVKHLTGIIMAHWFLACHGNYRNSERVQAELWGQSDSDCKEFQVLGNVLARSEYLYFV